MNWRLIARRICEHYTGITPQMVADMTLDQIWLLAADDKTVQASGSWRRGTAADLRAAGLPVSKHGSYFAQRKAEKAAQAATEVRSRKRARRQERRAQRAQQQHQRAQEAS